LSKIILLKIIKASSGRVLSTPLSNLCDDSVCIFNFLALLDNASGIKKALSIIIFFVSDVTENSLEPIIPAREIILFFSDTTIFSWSNLYSLSSRAFITSLFYQIRIFDIKNSKSCLTAFRFNNFSGFLIFIFIFLINIL